MAAAGVTSLVGLAALSEVEVGALPTSPLLRRALWRALCAPAVDPGKVVEVRLFLWRLLRREMAAVDAVVGVCGVQRLDDLRPPCDAVRRRIEGCRGLRDVDKRALLIAMDTPGGVPLEEDAARSDVRATVTAALEYFQVW